MAPDFRAGLHLGALVAGEIGGFKREITYLGDAMNTAARIAQAWRHTGCPLLVSKPLLDRAAPPPDIVGNSIGPQPTRQNAQSYLKAWGTKVATTTCVMRTANGREGWKGVVL